MAVQRITELRRTGAATVSEQLITFEWDSATHSMMQGTLDLELEVRTNREVPPGAQQPIEQILGVVWNPFELQGEWKDKWAGEGFAERTFREFARFVGRAPLVRFQTGVHSLVGIITKLRVRYATPGEYAWAVVFSPHINETIGPFTDFDTGYQVAKPASQRVEDIEDTLSVIELQLQIANSAIPTTTEDFETAFDEMYELQKAFEKLSEAVDAVSTESIDSATLVSTGVDRATSKLLGLAATFRNVRSVSETALLAFSERRSDLVVAYDDVLATLRAEEWIRTSHLDITKMIGIAMSGEADSIARAAKRPYAVHRCMKDEPLERISARYYGTPDEWRRIYDANNLDSVMLEAGQELLIPERHR